MESNSFLISELNRIKTRLAEVLTELDRFRKDYSEVAGNEVFRFELMCDRMFGPFMARDEFPCASTAAPVSNLDTGDASPFPFPPFLEALRVEVALAATDAHHYYGPEALPVLSEAAAKFIVREGFLKPPLISNMQVLPGSGTVHLYDAVCRVLIEKPGDTVLVPELGYGFFLTQPYRVSGRTSVVRCGARGEISPAALEEEIATCNRNLWDEWVSTSGPMVDRHLQRLGQAAALEATPEAQALISKVRDLVREGPQIWNSPPVRELVKELRLNLPESWCSQILLALRPPRVVALLHIQPTVTGHIYDETEAADIAAVLNRHEVAAIEDIAYHSIRCRLRDLPTLQGGAARIYTLIGVSKPFAIANFRLGLLYVARHDYERVRRALESTTGYVSSFLQRTLAQALLADEYEDYIARLSWGPEGYAEREVLMHRLLTGDKSDQEANIRAQVALTRAARQSPELSVFIDELLDSGLSRWFKPVIRPDAGFFYVISCERLLALPVFRNLGINCSFSVFALLAYVFDFRSIPEEAMRSGLGAGTRLRIAFSPPQDSIALRFLRVFAGLTLIERDLL